MGATRRHCGHCKSSKTTIATCAPLGGRNTGFTSSIAVAYAQANNSANRHNEANRFLDIFLVIGLIIIWIKEISSRATTIASDAIKHSRQILQCPALMVTEAIRDVRCLDFYLKRCTPCNPSCRETGAATRYSGKQPCLTLRRL